MLIVPDKQYECWTKPAFAYKPSKDIDLFKNKWGFSFYPIIYKYKFNFLQYCKGLNKQQWLIDLKLLKNSLYNFLKLCYVLKQSINYQL